MSDIEYFALLLPIGVVVITWIIRGKRKEDEAEHWMAIARSAKMSAEAAARYSDLEVLMLSRSALKTSTKVQNKCLYCATHYEDRTKSCTKCGAPA